MKRAIGLGVAWGVLLAFPLLLGQVAVVGPGDRLAWDPVTTDIEGNPETVVSSDVAISVDDIKTGGTILGTVAGDPTEADLTQLLTGLSPGVYLLWARVYDATGNVSEWSSPFSVQVPDRIPPEAPIGLFLVE